MDIIDETGTFYIDNFEYRFNGCDPGIYTVAKIYNTEGYCDLLFVNGGPNYQYYRKDHLGNNREVWNANGNVTYQRTQYYPSGLPWAESTNTWVQNKKYNGKEFVEAHGLDEYDSSARWFYPAIMRTTTIDPLAEKYYSISPYAWCENNPVRMVDPDGRLVVFINGMHSGSGGKSDYWKGFDTQVMNRVKDWNPDYLDGAIGGINGLPQNLSANLRDQVGYEKGKNYALMFLFAYKNNDGSFKENIKIIAHSMGAAYAKGFIRGLIEAGIPINVIEFEADFAPFQPTKQKAVKGVLTYQFSHVQDDVANNWILGSPPGKIDGVSDSKYSNEDDKDKVHSVNTFWDDIKKLPEGKYKIVNEKIVPVNQ